MREKRLVRCFGIIVFSLILFVLLSNFISAAITIVSPANNFNYSTTAVFNVSFINGTDYPNNILNATFYYNLSGAWTYIGFTADCNINSGLGAGGTNVSSCNATLNLPANSEGRYSINATLGNNTAYGASVITTNVVFDNTPPRVTTFYNVVDNGNYSGTINLNVTVNDTLEVSSVYFNITNSTGQVNFTRANNLGGGIYYNLTINTLNYPDGKYNVTVYANDTLNNLNKSQRIQGTIDNTAPTISLSKSSSTTSSMVVSYSCSDATSGLESCTLSSSSGTVSGSTISGLSCAISYTITVSAEDNTGNTASSSGSFSTEGCGGIITPSLPKKVGSFALITPGKAAILKNFDSKIGVKEIQIEVSNEAQNVKITVTKYDRKPAEVSVAKSGIVYQYIQIDTQNLNENLDKAVVQFRVEKSWIANNNLQKENVAVHKFDNSGNIWSELTTTYNSEDNTYYYYDIELESFSYFAIGEKVQVASGEGEEEETITETLTKNYSWVWIIIVVVILTAIFFLFKKIKKKKGRQ